MVMDGAAGSDEQQQHQQQPEEGRLKHLFVTVFLAMFSSVIAIPAITDITMEALCPGRDECSLAIYLSGFQQAIIGLGSVVITPLIGNLSDAYGRKAFLTLPLTAAILPLVVLAYSRETTFFYTYYILRTLTAMVGEASINCLALAYVADVVPETKRATAFGILTGVISSAFVFGTLAAKVLTVSQSFKVAGCVAMVSTVYMRIFLKETISSVSVVVRNSEIEQPILKDEQQSQSSSSCCSISSKKSMALKSMPSVGDITSLLKSSKTFSQVASISFFYSLSEGGLQASLLYFLKAQFHFNKNQFADLLLIFGIGGMFSQLLLMPVLVPLFGEERLLTIGLSVAVVNMLLNSIAWSPWVPYVMAGSSVFFIFSNPCIRSIASKQVGVDQQGKAQGCISGISSFANIISPLVFSPLTALFLSETAPFHFPGFSIMCLGVATMIAFIQSLMVIKAAPPTNNKDDYDVCC